MLTHTRLMDTILSWTSSMRAHQLARLALGCYTMNASRRERNVLWFIGTTSVALRGLYRTGFATKGWGWRKAEEEIPSVRSHCRNPRYGAYCPRVLGTAPGVLTRIPGVANLSYLPHLSSYPGRSGRGPMTILLKMSIIKISSLLPRFLSKRIILY